MDDLRAWLESRGPAYDGQRERLAGVDYSFLPLAGLRQELADGSFAHTWRS